MLVCMPSELLGFVQTCCGCCQSAVWVLPFLRRCCDKVNITKDNDHDNVCEGSIIIMITSCAIRYAPLFLVPKQTFILRPNFDHNVTFITFH